MAIISNNNNLRVCSEKSFQNKLKNILDNLQ